MMIQSLYVFSFVISLILIIFLIKLFQKQMSVYYPLLFCASVVCNLGYMQLAFSKDIESALQANQVIYSSASFTPFLSFMCVTDLCKTKARHFLVVICIIVSCIVFSCASTIGIFPVYYESVSLEQFFGVSYLQKTYGPLHIIYPAYLIFMSLATLLVISRALRHQKKISYKVSLILTFLFISEVIIYMAERLLDSKLEFMPFSYTLVNIGLLILLNRIKLYNVSEITGKSMSESYDYGFIVCTYDKRLAGTDGAARKWFPELNELKIDYRIKNTGTDFLDQLDKWLSDTEIQDTIYFEREGRIIEAKYKVIDEKKKKSIRYVSLRDDTYQQMYIRKVEDYSKDLADSVKEKTQKLQYIQKDIILSMASIVENRDNNTGGHIRRTSDIICIFVEHLMRTDKFPELNEEIADCIIKAAPLHDFGKIAIPDKILNKPGKFTDEEYAVMKKHSEKGAVIVAGILQNAEDIMFRNIAVNIANYHHEKWDGTGYPDGLKEKGIPFEARVMALADVFDALVSKRVYKESFDYDKAFRIISESCGQHFDPELCKEFLKCRPVLEALYNNSEK